jgi:pyruvate formate lyase activating enzyme
MGNETVGKDVTVAEVMEVIEKDRSYYRHSGGGLTLSGGEVLRQPDFARELLRKAKDNGIHTAIESTALADYREIETLLPFIDVFLMDIKHTDPVKHERFTGQRNDRALENAERIAASGKTELIIRVPVVPGFNATNEEIKNIALFVQGLPGVNKIHLLPYHRLGEGKYELLKRDYAMKSIEPPGDNLMDELMETVTRTTSLHCQIGG